MRGKIRITKLAIIITLASVLFLSLVGLGFIIYTQSNSIKAIDADLSFTRQILASNTKKVLVPKRNIPTESKLTSDLFEYKTLLLEYSLDFYLSEKDFGRVNRIELLQGQPVVNNLLADEILPDDIRKLEYNALLLQSDLQTNTFIDVRIAFATGEDFIVATKKKVQKLDAENNNKWLNLDEEEIIKMNSAIVDAYLNKGTKLYIAAFVDPVAQEEAIPTYIPKPDVIALIQSDPNIVQKASAAIYAKLLSDREDFDARLLQISTEDSAKIDSGVRQEIQSIQNSVPTQPEDSIGGDQNEESINTGQDGTAEQSGITEQGSNIEGADDAIFRQ